MPGMRSHIKDFLSAIDSSSSGRIYNLSGSSMALYLAHVQESVFVLGHGEQETRRLWDDIICYRKLLGIEGPEVLYIPSADGGPEAEGMRAHAVFRLVEGGSGISLVAAIEAFDRPLWNQENLLDSALILERGTELSRVTVEERLLGLGYVRMPLVTDRGQYSVRGYILDVFPSTGPHPLRVEFFGDVIDDVRSFDPDTQRSIRQADSFVLLPSGDPDAGGTGPEALYEGRRVFALEPAPETGLPDNATHLSRFAIAGEGADSGLLMIPGMGIMPGERKDMSSLAPVIKSLVPQTRVVFFSSSGGQAERLRDIMREGDVTAPIIPLQELPSYDGAVSITVGGPSAGFYAPGLLVLTEEELFGGKPAYRPIKRTRVRKLLATIDDLAVGDYVVHADKGIGRFVGLQRHKVEDLEYELIALEYSGGDRLYLPLSSIDLIKKYHAQEGSETRLERLGTTAWKRTRERVRKRIRDMADQLLKIYAEREVSEGFASSPDTEMHREFESFFPYEETPDQLTAIEEIKRDMESGRPMDRLLCGDVGYGKTEVAMRAAFKAVFDNRQVVVLVPTTLLCEQHARIFKKRFAAFPVKVDFISRFKSTADKKQTIEEFERGNIDVLIATHSILRAGLKIRNLGLLIIDEEHRFGVAQKERLKELRRGIDVLTLSATPIPRTLQMSLSGIRGMSLIETPPEERLSVVTTVAVAEDRLIREAIERELRRDGQVFFVHNRIEDIERVARRVRNLVPDARIEVAHGRTKESELERIMLEFLNGSVDILVSTAIVGAGLDIPTANTMIVDMADRMGLADLYQLKGRVGRSNVRAYAYFLVPNEDAITDDARKRLQALQELSYVGAGFRLAMKDLEIRGAGNLLGAEQSGNIDAVGLDLYMEMLERTVAELKGMPIEEKMQALVSISLNAFVPEEYIEDISLRLSAYRAVAGAYTEGELEDVRKGLSDRFGPLPEECENLIRVMGLRILASGLGISELSQTGRRLGFALSEGSRLTPDVIVAALGAKVRFTQKGFEYSLGKGDEIVAGARAVMGRLRGALGE